MSLILHRRKSFRDSGPAPVQTKCFRGDGITGQVTMDSGPGWSQQTSLTIAFRLKWTDDVSASTLFWGGVGRHVNIGRDSGAKFSLRVHTTGGDSVVTSTLGHDDDTWAQYVFHYQSSNTTGTLYKNGTQIAQKTNYPGGNITAIDTQTPIFAKYVDGCVDMLAVYDSIKSLTDFYDGGVFKDPPVDALLIYKGQDVIGNAVSDSVNSNDGTISGNITMENYTV